MPFRTRFRKIVKWTALAAMLVLTAIWTLSGWIRISYYNRAGSLSVAFGLVSWFKSPRVSDPPVRLTFEPDRYSRRGWHERHLLAWYFGSDGNDIPLCYGIPPFAAIWLSAWKLDRTAALRARNNCCKKCVYHRAGLKPDVLCPECGVGVKA